jgi:hypothetical protein
VFHHVVMFRFADPAHPPEAARLLRSMVGRVDVIRRLDVRLNTLPDVGNVDLLLHVTVDDPDDYATYDTDPFHVSVKQALGAMLRQGEGEFRWAVDYED